VLEQADSENEWPDWEPDFESPVEEDLDQDVDEYSDLRDKCIWFSGVAKYNPYLNKHNPVDRQRERNFKQRRHKKEQQQIRLLPDELKYLPENDTFRASYLPSWIEPKAKGRMSRRNRHTVDLVDSENDTDDTFGASHFPYRKQLKAKRLTRRHTVDIEDDDWVQSGSDTSKFGESHRLYFNNVWEEPKAVRRRRRGNKHMENFEGHDWN